MSSLIDIGLIFHFMPTTFCISLEYYLSDKRWNDVNSAQKVSTMNE